MMHNPTHRTVTEPHRTAQYKTPPLLSPPEHQFCTRSVLGGGLVDASTTDHPDGGPVVSASQGDWEQAANIAILKAMIHFPGREPASTWKLARKAAEWMRQTQIKYPEKAVPDYLLKKIMDEYQKLPVMP